MNTDRVNRLKINFGNSGLLLACLFSILRLPAQEAKDYFLKGKIDYNNARFEKAIENFSKAIQLDSSDVNFFLQRGFCYGRIQNFNAAIADFTKVIERESSNTQAYISRGAAYNKTNNYDAAMQDFNKAIELNPAESEAYNNRGFTRKAMGDFHGACEDWHKSKQMGNEEAVIILKNNRCK